MRWSRRKSASRARADLLRRLELLGRFEMDPPGSGIDSTEVIQTSIAPFTGYVDDPKALAEMLSGAVEGERSGFATYGASCLIVELAGSDFRTADSLAVLDAAIMFKRERGLPSARLKGYEWKRWLEVNGPDTW
ncbi:hypothetical protein [Actinomadura rayongensis]|uniref:Uncharacterized protein n=1 Tax=Actinomadura rayongensis TaxID=1429076 RepID=A0A6I4W2P8_9ACTN|nr:hypothetical protein [Actinomadura rayongensis]MXQ64889.1 hypothetical protein [Actinomadura rayongensis]